MLEVNLTTKELNRLKQIGFGTDGRVYQFKNNLLIKIYHQALNRFLNELEPLDEIKIYQKGMKEGWKDFWYKNTLLYFHNEEDNENQVKLYPKSAVKKAILRGTELNLTKLPIGLVYLNNHFAGCLLEKQKGIELHKLMGLPLNTRKKIYLNVLEAVYELYKHNIYHCDLANSPYIERIATISNKKIIIPGHSHIFVEPFSYKTNLIDLEGKSTIYTEKENKTYLRKSEQELNILTLEFLLQLDFEEYKNEPELIIPLLEEKGIVKEIDRQKLASLSMNINEIKELTLSLKK